VCLSCARMKRTNIHLPEQMLKRLKALAKRKGIPFSEIVRAAIDLYLAKEGA
jgi:predicted DNA-binding protein